MRCILCAVLQQLGAARRLQVVQGCQRGQRLPAAAEQQRPPTREQRRPATGEVVHGLLAFTKRHLVCSIIEVVDTCCEWRICDCMYGKSVHVCCTIFTFVCMIAFVTRKFVHAWRQSQIRVQGCARVSHRLLRAISRACWHTHAV
jgi:hypothetical protein